MTKIKKPISILLSVLMVLSVFAAVPFTASAAVGDFVPETEYLTFTAEEAGSSVTLDYANGTLKYNKNNSGWVDYAIREQIDLENAGDSVRFRGKDTVFSRSYHVSIGGKVACSGNVMSLRLDDNGMSQGLNSGCFQYMFYSCQGLTTAPELPETNLANSCYYYMFSGCTNLTTAPDLPATTLANSCYYYMFYRCTSLTQAPELPATELGDSCYYRMFYGCENLTKAPELPATELAGSCYCYMFSGCIKLTKAPELPATNLADSCYSNMFYGCTSLTELPALPATTLARTCYNYMFNGCSKICISDEAGTFDGITYSAEYRIPTTGEGTSAYNALYNMFRNTGGKFTGTPDINTTYYVPAPAATYTVTWKNEDGKTLKTDTDVEEGTTPTYDGATPTKAEDEQNTYTFSGWTDGTNTYGKDDTLPAVSGDVTYTAQFDAVPKIPVEYYIVGTMNGWTTGDAYKLTKNPANDAEYMFTDLTVSENTELKVMDSNGVWYPNEDNFKLNDAGTYDIYFRPDGKGGDGWHYGNIFANNYRLPTYTVTWKNEDGTTLKTDTVEKDAVPAYTGTAPEKAEDANYTYTFSGWTDGTTTYGKDDTLPAVTGDVTYTATFDSTKRSYTITWKNDDGSVIDTNTVEYGETPTHAAPEKAEDEQNTYTFSGWTDGTNTYGKDDTLPAVTGDITYTATFTATEKQLNGPQDDGYFYLDDVKQIRYQLIQWHGDYYFINDGDKYAKNAKLYLSNTYVAGTGLSAGLYEFGADGKMQLKNGPQPDGYFYENGIRSNKLYRFVEFEGDWYFIYDGYKYAKNARLYLSGAFLEGTDFAPGYFDFDADGKYYIPEELPEGANADGYFYINGVKQTRYQLIKYGNDYYFINDDDKYAKNTKLYLSDTFVSGTDLPAGLYEFGADGKMIISVMKNGPQDDGYFYINGARCQKLYRFVEFEGDWYFINDGYKYAKNARLYLGNAFLEGTDFAPGYFVFGADGKLVTA